MLLSISSALLCAMMSTVPGENASSIARAFSRSAVLYPPSPSSRAPVYWNASTRSPRYVGRWR